MVGWHEASLRIFLHLLSPHHSWSSVSHDSWKLRGFSFEEQSHPVLPQVWRAHRCRTGLRREPCPPADGGRMKQRRTALLQHAVDRFFGFLVLSVLINHHQPSYHSSIVISHLWSM